MRSGERQSLLDIVHQLRLRHFQADLAHRILEQQTVFGFLDRFDLGADQLDAVLVQHARFGQIDRQIQSGLAAHCGKQRIWTLLANHFFGERDAQRFDVGSIRQIRDRS